MSALFRRGVVCRLNRSKPFLHRSFGFSPRSSSWRTERDAVLRKVYAPFAELSKGTPEYKQLAESGKVWEDYFQPGDSERYGYVKLQKLHGPLLDEIDGWRESMKLPKAATIRSLIAEYAHQSVAIENNQLRQGESVLIDDHLASTFFKDVVPDLASVSVVDLAQMALPDVHALLPHADASQVAELRNHIVASHWVTEAALRNPGTAGLSEDEIRYLSAVLLKETNAEVLYKHGWGGQIAMGDYRPAPIQVKSNPLRIFPYHVEVPACMQRFIQWRERVTQEKRLHPLIVACQATAYFLHIHPFSDGNGRVSRLIMQDYMIRHGYAPVVIQALEREDYLEMIKNAQDGQPDEFVHTILTTQLEELKTFGMREMASG
ncbi:fic doc family [Trichoderma arundinaceum]|uniref:Fic doc family n=1 Tax=Trichoderma arundinaceum TaxID=490622 RepID=A0A395NBD6_TRIAR|nr:fic doc family [Trichoderma arundinaceum]